MEERLHWNMLPRLFSDGLSPLPLPGRVRRGLPLGWGSGGLTPGKFFKPQIAVREFWRISDEKNLSLIHRFRGPPTIFEPKDN
jgi:hypothetical protein